MVIACWSVKGGSGTTVVAAALALRLARSGSDVVVADLAGDVPAVLGRPEPTGPGLVDWLAAGSDVAADALDRLAVEAGPGLSLLAAGDTGRGDATTAADGERLVAALGAVRQRVAVVDCGRVAGADVAGLGIATAATRSLLVVRPCFLALRRAVACTDPPIGRGAACRAAPDARTARM